MRKREYSIYNQCNCDFPELRQVTTDRSIQYNLEGKISKG